MATRIPRSVPSVITPSIAATAQRNSVRPTCLIAANSRGAISPIEVTITTAARVACGMSEISGARKSSTPAVAATVIKEAIGDRAPALVLTAV